MSVAERLQLVEDLWDSIALEAPDDGFPMSPALAAELDRQLADAEAHSEAGLPWDEVRKRIVEGTLGASQ